MASEPIVTLTLNPAIDATAEAEKVRPIRKIRTWGESYYPGGGGINAARVIKELGGSAFVIYLSGGAAGSVLDKLVEEAGLRSRRIVIEGDTRVSHTVHESSSGLEFRFVPQGPVIARSEWEASLASLDEIDCEFLVASGSLPRGVPDDFYTHVAAVAARKKAKFVLDTSGSALRKVLENEVYLIKPSLGELEDLVGRNLSTPTAQETAVQTLIQSGHVHIVALTLGQNGALLATRNGLRRLDGVKVSPKSAVGAGDSFLAAMTLGLARGRTPEDAFTLGVAAGTAAVLTAGAALCRREDVERIHAELQKLTGGAGI
jgi:6-phosphofructokinase 2